MISNNDNTDETLGLTKKPKSFLDQFNDLETSNEEDEVNRYISAPKEKDRNDLSQLDAFTTIKEIYR